MSDHVEYRLILAGRDSPLPVHSFVGREAMNKPYRFDVEVGTASALEDSIGSPAHFTWSLNGKVQRRIAGVVSAVAAVGVDHRRVRIVPSLWCLKLIRRSRIFQDLTARQVIEKVLFEAGVNCAFQLAEKYPTRPFCTQYEESDYAFVSRLAAENGWFFFFQDLSGRPAARGSSPGDLDEDGVLFSDDADTYVGLGSSSGTNELHYAPMTGAGAGAAPHDAVTEFEVSHVMSPTQATYRVYDPARPATVLSAHEETDRERLRRRALIERASIKEGDAHHDGEFYEHHGGHLHPDWDFGKAHPRRMLRQLRRKYAVASGRSHCPRMMPGSWFELADHPDDQRNGRFALTEVVHRGVASPTDEHDVDYVNEHVAVPADTPFPPAYPARRNVISNVTATVITESDDSAYSRGMAEVKVQFHWERERTDPHGSCWIRCMNAWGGTHWGTQFIPRAGMEVVVGFEGGDPDKPFVMGSLYNGLNSPPFALPTERFKSGLRTHGQDGAFNELSFDDKTGEELVFLRAERDMSLSSEADFRRSTGMNEHLTVGGGRWDRVGASTTTVQKNMRLEVGGSLTVGVLGNEDRVVRGAARWHIQGASTRQFDGRDLQVFTGASTREHAGDVTTVMRGSSTMTVGTLGAERSHQLHVEGTAASYGSRLVELRSDREIVLRCGDSVMRMSPTGLEFEAPRISVNNEAARIELGKGGLKMMVGGVLVDVADKRFFVGTSEGALLSLGRDARIDANQILLNSPDFADDPPPDEKEPPTIIELVDDAGRPLPQKRYIVTLPDGSEVSGHTNADGRAELDLPDGATVMFPSLHDVTGAGDPGDDELPEGAFSDE